MKSVTKSNIRGVITALATPFKDGAIDEKSFVKLIKRQMEDGVDGMVVNGTTGESPTLNAIEVKRLFEVAKSETGGKIPLIVGTGSNSTADTVEFTKEMCRWKPDAVLVVVPYYNRPPQRGLIQHFTAVADASSAPVILYNVPGRTVASLEVPAIAELSKHQNILGIKEATGNMEILEEMVKSVSKGFTLLSGDDLSSVEFCARGGQGVISVSSHIIGKEMKSAIAKAAQKGAVSEYVNKYAEFMKHLYIEANPIPVKAALHWMGLFESMEMRLPLASLEGRFHKEFKACLAALGKI